MTRILCAALLAAILFNVAAPAAFAQTRNAKITPVQTESLLPSTFDIVGPSGSGAFGAQVLVLSNGNIVITDPGYDDGAVTDVGAVYLYNPSGVMISQLKGSTASDQVGGLGITDLGNGNFVVRSLNWDNGAVSNVGAVTWGSGTTGVSGVVSSSNSLVGSTASNQVGRGGVFPLTNGNYVVSSPYWDNGAVTDAGAATWGSGTVGVSGVVSSSNSLVGSKAYDYVGTNGATALTNGNYVVMSPYWDNGAIGDAGAATWGSGTAGVTGVVSSSNSLVGSSVNDLIAEGGVTALTNGNYVVRSQNWDNGAVLNAGAATWGSGTAGVTGVVSSSNSLVGSTAGDIVGLGVTALTNGNYVVRSTNWDNGAATDAGAVTWGSGTAGITGAVSSSNSLVGSTAGDSVGDYGVTALTNGNYVVMSPYWDNGAVADTGAITWGSGTAGITGVVSSSNSLVGSTADDIVGIGGVIALTNGNYVVMSPYWDNGAATDAGAATWGSGTTGITGAVSASNSLVGSTANDYVGGFGIGALTNGNYFVVSDFWDNGAVSNAGAVTWGSGTAGITGAVSSSNSLVGSTAGDNVGTFGYTTLTNGNYIVFSGFWDNGAATDVGAVSFGDGATGTSGAVSSANSVIGTTSGGGPDHVFSANSSSRWAVGRPADNIVTIPLSSPTSAGVKIEGRVVTSAGLAISRSRVMILNLSTGVSSSVMTNNFGRFSFESLPVGSYVVTVESSRRHRFDEASRVINLYEDLTDVVFRAAR